MTSLSGAGTGRARYCQFYTDGGLGALAQESRVMALHSAGWDRRA